MESQPIVVPRMGESISEATVSALLVTAKTHVHADQEILELETEKVNHVLYAPCEGVVEWQVAVGDRVKVGQTVGSLVPRQVESSPQVVPPAKADIKKFLEEIDAPKSSLEAEVQSVAVAPVGSRETRQPFPKIRQVIAERLVQAQHQAAMLTTFNEIDMTVCMGLRKREQEDFFKKYQVKLGLLSFFIKASVRALKAYPAVNTYVDGAEWVQRHYYDISVAVSTEKGLVVPVLRGCDQLSLADIEGQLQQMAIRAREGKLSLEEMRGGSFTITNGGIFGSMLSTPILNPPQVAILGMHKIVDRPVAVEGRVEIRPIMYVALTYDHRVIDGKEAVGFLVDIKQSVEDPGRLLW